MVEEGDDLVVRRRRWSDSAMAAVFLAFGLGSLGMLLNGLQTGDAPDDATLPFLRLRHWMEDTAVGQLLLAAMVLLFAALAVAALWSVAARRPYLRLGVLGVSLQPQGRRAISVSWEEVQGLSVSTTELGSPAGPINGVRVLVERRFDEPIEVDLSLGHTEHATRALLDEWLARNGIDVPLD